MSRQQRLPTLREAPLPALPGDAVRNLASPVTVSAGGHLVTQPPGRSPDGKVLLLMDSTGAPVTWIARRGSGPGEVTIPSFTTFLGDSLFAVWDMGSARLTLFRLDGELAEEFTFDQTHVPLALHADSLDVRALRSDRDSEWERVSWRDANSRQLIPAGDTAFRRAFPEQGTLSRPVIRAQAYAAAHGRVVLADGQDNLLLFYTEGGRHLGRASRTLPPVLPGARLIALESLAVTSQPVGDGQKRQLLDRFRERPLRHFQRIRFDGAERLWVVRTNGESAQADLYADTVYLGTIEIPCPGFSGQGWDLADRWLAITCVDERPEAISDGTIKLFRIEG